MKRADVIAGLEHVVEDGDSYLWLGIRCLDALPTGIDPKLVERVMRVTFKRVIAKACRRLPDEYVPIAWRVIAKQKSPDATFLRSYADLRAGSAWLIQAAMVDRTPRNRKRLEPLCADVTGLAAAQATVVAHGLEAKQLIAVLAHDGSDTSIDALVETLHHALTARDQSLDALAEWLTPFARGPRIESVVGELAQALAARGAGSPLLALAARFGHGGDRLVFQLAIDARKVRQGRTRVATGFVDLSSHTMPNARASITWTLTKYRRTRWEDGRVTEDELELGGPRDVDDIPRWLAASAKKLKIQWNPKTIRVSGLRQKARAAAIAWVLASG